MKVYHGSYIKIDRIDYAKCRLYRDFGRGFYVTKILEQAKIWAKRKGEIYDTQGIITEYDFAESAFENWEFQCIRFDGYTEEWLDFIILNRNLKLPIPAHDYDIIEGPVADDDVTNRIDDYLEGHISKSDFLEELKFHRPTHQICFCTHRSLQALEHVEKKHIPRIDDTLIEALIMDYNMVEEKAIDLYFDSNTYARLIDENNEFYLQPWIEIYEYLLQELKLKKQI